MNPMNYDYDGAQGANNASGFWIQLDRDFVDFNTGGSGYTVKFYVDPTVL